MRCPECGSPEDKVVDSRSAEDGTVIRRRRECTACSTRFTTLERIETPALTVRKRDGRSVPFERSKVEAGVLSACKGRPVTIADIASLAARVEEDLSSRKGDVTTDEIGRKVLAGLRELDRVAAVRFASVYKAFEDPEDFEKEIRLLGEKHPD